MVVTQYPIVLAFSFVMFKLPFSLSSNGGRPDRQAPETGIA